MSIRRQFFVLTVSVAVSIQAAAADRSDHRPVLSPDGGKIAFMSMSEATGGDWELFVMDADGRNLKRLTENPGWDGYAVWSPDGRTLIFDRSLTGDGDNLAPHSLNLETGEATRFMERDGWVSISDWSDGGLLGFWERDGQRDLYMFDENGGVVDQVTATPDISETDAQLSPDGKKIAFASWPASGDGETALDVIDLKSGNRKTLRRSPGRIYGLAWSPNGGSIAFTDAPGGEEDDADIFVIDAKSGDITAITDDEAWDHMPVWTRDGAAIVFTSYRTDEERIYLSPGPGGAVMRVWAGGGE